MEKEELDFLQYIIAQDGISLYTLIEIRMCEEKDRSYRVVDDVLKKTYSLVGRRMIELEIVEGKDGTETIIKSTPFGKSYLKSEKITRRRI